MISLYSGVVFRSLVGLIGFVMNGIVEERKELYYVKYTLTKIMHVIFTKFKCIEGIAMICLFFICSGLFCI